MSDAAKGISAGKDRPMTYYDVLDLDRDATADDIKAAYYALARQYHPDAAQDPNIAQKFALISEAYRVLSDTQRRYQYDRTLPQKSYPLRHPTPAKVWREATDVVLLRSDRFGPLNQAMQSTIPVCIDGHLLVVTIPGSERHLAGHMETAANRNSIMNALELVYGSRLDFRLIDGATVDDWEALKAAEARAREASASRAGAERAAPAAPAARPGEGPWDELLQRMHKSYQELNRRQYPQVKARYLREVLGWIGHLEDEMRFAPDADEEAVERAVARAVERVATLLSVPSLLVALHMDALRRAGEI
jgi:hypothetical protein